MTELKPDVIFITESWANKYIASAELSLNCYTMYRRDRNLDDNGEVIRGGGVLMYIETVETGPHCGGPFFGQAGQVDPLVGWRSCY